MTLRTLGTNAASLATTFAGHGEYGVTYDASANRELLDPTIVQYNPVSSAQVFINTDTTWSDIDATNLKVSFVAPQSGKVRITLSALAGCSTGSQQVQWALRDGATSRMAYTTTRVCSSGSANAMNGNSHSRSIVVDKDGAGTALVPGTLYTFYWQHRGTISTVVGYTEYGGSFDGPAVMEVQPLSNRITTKSMSTAVTQPTWLPWDVAADNTHMIGWNTSLNRIGHSANGGSSWTSLPNLATPSAASLARYAGDGEILVLAGINSAPGKVYKSTGWAAWVAGGATPTFSVVLTANNDGGGNNVYFANYASFSMRNGMGVLNEYGPKTATDMAKYVYLTTDYGTTWRSILNLKTFIQGRLGGGWDGSSAHVHSAVYDPYWDAMWVVAGDYNSTVLPYTLVSFDWRSTTPTWSVVYTGHQFTSIVVMPGCLLFGTDGWGNVSGGDTFGNGLLRLRRTTPKALLGSTPVFEAAMIFDNGSAITTLGVGSRRHTHIPDAPTIIGFGRTSQSGVTGRLFATYDGFTFRELWTASDTGTTGSIGSIVGPINGVVTAAIQQAADSYAQSLVTITAT